MMMLETEAAVAPVVGPVGVERASGGPSVLRHPLARAFGAYLFVGFLWGITNPFIKAGTKLSDGARVAEDPRQSFTKLQRVVAYVIGDNTARIFAPKVFLPFAVNQVGSVLFLFLVGKGDMAKAVPVVNALTSLFTFFTELWLFKQIPSKRALIGCLAVIAGVFLCST